MVFFIRAASGKLVDLFPSGTYIIPNPLSESLPTLPSGSRMGDVPIRIFFPSLEDTRGARPSVKIVGQIASTPRSNYNQDIFKFIRSLFVFGYYASVRYNDRVSLYSKDGSTTHSNIVAVFFINQKRKNMEKKLYVGNLPFNASEEDLKDLFSQAGVVTSVAIIKDRDSGQSKGFAFIEMADQEASQNAIKLFNGYSFNSRELKVNPAKPKEDNRRPFNGPKGNRGGKGGNNSGKSRGYGSNRSNY